MISSICRLGVNVAKKIVRLSNEQKPQKFGVPIGIEQHVQCIVELDRIRVNQDRRTGVSADLP